MTSKVIPAFDAALNRRVKAKVMGLAHITGLVLISDMAAGPVSSVQNRPIANALASIPAGSLGRWVLLFGGDRHIRHPERLRIRTPPS